MRIEPATLDDLDRLVDCWIDLAAEQRTHGGHLTTDGNRELMRSVLAQHVINRLCFVALADTDSRQADLLGFVSFDLETDGLDRDVRRGVVQNLYVDPSARGRGVGGSLLTAAEEALVAAGAERIVLETIAGNDEARRFYEARGYTPHRVTYERGTESATKEGP